MPTATTIRTATEQRVELANGGQTIRSLLMELYQERRLSQAEIADTLGISRRTVLRWMRRHQVATGYNWARS